MSRKGISPPNRAAEYSGRPRLSTAAHLGLLKLALLSLLAGLVPKLPGLAAPANGLLLTLSKTGNPNPVSFVEADVMISSNIALYVASGASPSPFLPPGKFTARWDGSLLSDLRAEYRFEAELAGTLEVQINGTQVYAAGPAPAQRSPTVRLNKGTNLLSIRFESPAQGEAFLRFFWVPPENQPEPIPAAALLLPPNIPPLSVAAQERRRGRDLFLQNRCVRCHQLQDQEKADPGIQLDAPTFENIGARLNPEWMAAWILNPKLERGTAHMPQLLFGPNAARDAADLAVYLASLKPKAAAVSREYPAGMVEPGKSLFDTLHCAACHSGSAAGATNESAIGLAHVRRKFVPATLEEYLIKPELHYAWNPMPNFKLSLEEAGKLTAYLLSLDTKAEPPRSTLPSAQTNLDRGKQLLQTSGCLNCHSLSLSNAFKAPPLTKLSPDKWTRGCLRTDSGSLTAPLFGWTESERQALQVFAKADLSSINRLVPADYARRQIDALRCVACHGQIEGLPNLALLGGKLNPAWAGAFISGEVSDKPRPWLEARMPGFAKYGYATAGGLAMDHGYPPQRQQEPPVNAELAAIGQKLVSPEGGFSCISCHAVGRIAATAVFESAGINFAYSGERLLKPYFRRWLHNPPRIDPETKMPVYFIEGKSSLTDVLDGDADLQINALWEYVRLGEKMPPPPGVAAPP